MIRVATRLVLVALLAIAPIVPTHGQTGTVMPMPKFVAFDDNGNPCNGCLLYSYSAGTSTPLSTYTDVTLGVANANPVVLDSAGRATVFLGTSSYKFILKTAAGVTLWTVDNVQSVNLTSSLIGERKFVGGASDSPITVTSYPSGATFDKLHVESSVYSIDAAQIPSGTYVLECNVMSVGGVTVTAGLMNLSDGAPDTALVTVSSTSSTGAVVQSSSITFAASGSAKAYGVKTKVSSGTGYVWGCHVRRTA